MSYSLDQYIKNYIQSFIHSFESAYNSSHSKTDNVPVFYYGDEFSNSPFEVVPYQSIVFAWERTPEEIDNAIREYQFPGDGSFAIQVFHEDMNPQKFKMRYQPLGYEYYLPNILQIADPSASFDTPALNVRQVTETAQGDFINRVFSDFKPFPSRLIGAADDTAFYAEIDGQAAGWGFLTHDNPHTAYVAGMFTSPNFRRKGVASALLKAMHEFSLERGLKKVILVPSFMAWNFYTKRGYQTIAHFSTFLPSDNEAKEAANTRGVRL